MKQNIYIVATVKPWNIEQFHKKISRYNGRWVLITDPKKLTPEFVKKLKPRYIFFPHWSWIVPKDILDVAECVCFHETPLPYGRGGSPIQNMIANGHKKTKISALRMEEGLDTGPIYVQKPLSLSGSAQEIFERAAPIVADLIRWIVEKEPTPKLQRGKVVVFKRRTSAQGNLCTLKDQSAGSIYDTIRMLDADTYPRAYIETESVRIEFKNARKEKAIVRADVTIINKKHD